MTDDSSKSLRQFAADLGRVYWKNPGLGLILTALLAHTWVKQKLGLHECNKSGCEERRVRGYKHCLDHGAGYR